MSNDQPTRRPPAKSSGGGAPMGSTISIIVAVVAVIVGFLILRNINNDGTKTSAGTDNPSSSVTTTNPGGVVAPTTIPQETTTPPTSALVLAGSTVAVANASGINGAAKAMSTALGKVGFTMGTPVDGSVKSPVTLIYISTTDPNAAAVGASVAAQFNDPKVFTAPMPTPIPVKGASIGKATVLVLVGIDYAGKALPALAGAATTTTLPASGIGAAASSTVAG